MSFSDRLFPGGDWDEEPDSYQMVGAPARCDDCGVLLARHGGECGYEIGDHASGYFESPEWRPA